MNTRQKIALVVNLLILAELCISMYLAGKDPDNFTSVFFKFFLGMLIPTLILASFIIKRIVPGEQELKPQPVNIISPQTVDRATKDDTATTVFPRKLLFGQQAMNLEQISKLRKFARRMGAIFFILVFVTILDGCIAKFREPINVFNILPGQSIKVDGPLDSKIKNTKELTYTSTSDNVRLSFDAIQTRFWLGGNMWIGTVTTNKLIQPGEYDVTVYPRGETDIKKKFIFRIKVFKDYESYRQSFKSIIKRYLDFSPWWILLFCLPLGALTVGIVWYLSQRFEELLAREGKAEIYRIIRGDNGCEISFGLGTKHGVQPGTRLSLLNESGRPVGSAVVQKVSETDSLALVGLDCAVKQGYIVSLEKRY